MRGEPMPDVDAVDELEMRDGVCEYSEIRDGL